MFLFAINWNGGLEDAWSTLATFVPKFIGFLAVLVIGTLIAKTVRKVLRKVLTAARIDQFVAKSGFGKTLKGAGITSASDLLVKVLYIGLMLLVWQLAIGTLGISAISDALNSMLAFVPKIAVAIVILFVTGIVAEKVHDIVATVTNKQSFGRLATKAAQASIWIIGGFAALDQIEVARNVVDTLFQTLATSLGAILVIKFGVGGVWAARDRFWPGIYDTLGMKKAKPAE